MQAANPNSFIKKYIKDIILKAYGECVSDGLLDKVELVDFDIEIPKDNANGDYSSNFAMKNVRLLKKAPNMIGQLIIDKIADDSMFAQPPQIAGPGFINFKMSNKYYDMILSSILNLGKDYGKSDFLNNEKIIVEFVSANPTGPMHMGNARGGIIGDCLSEVLKWCGADVYKEFYVNDAGNQVALFGQSLYVRLYQLVNGKDSMEFPDDGYHGDDIKELAALFLEKNGQDVLNLDKDELTKKLVSFGLERNISKMQKDLAKYKIYYDNWFKESTLHESGYVKETIDLLDKKGAIYEKDGAKWFRASDYGCEKDEVMVKANGFYTYYAVDLAYHRNKFTVRNFDRAIDVLGADHHGHTLRYKAGLKALGIDSERLQVVLMQLVSLMRDGQVVKMSKRTGKSISLNDLLDEIPADAARFFFNLRQSESAMEFDLSLAVKKDNENPLYYVQYAHARICSVLKNLGVDIDSFSADVDCSVLQSDSERELMRLLALFPDEVALAATGLEPSRITRYAVSVASAFHSFYNSCRIKGESEKIKNSRLALAVSAKTVLKNSLELMSITAPESM